MLVPSTGKDHFLLLIDILGFSTLCRNENPEKIYQVINRLVEKGLLWQDRDLGFKILYFSDTILFYQKEILPIRQAFNDIYVIASKIFTTLASENIPIRGAISYGQFITRDNSNNHITLFYGEALVQAAELEKKSKWLGISITNIAIEKLEIDQKNMLITSKVIHNNSEYFQLDPFYRIRDSVYDLKSDLIDDYDYKTEVKALTFIAKQVTNTNLDPEVRLKYKNTIDFIKSIYPNDFYPEVIDILE